METIPSRPRSVFWARPAEEQVYLQQQPQRDFFAAFLVFFFAAFFAFFAFLAMFVLLLG